MLPRMFEYTANGLTFQVTDEGPLDGEPIVLLHGFPQTAHSWRRVTPMLHQAGYRTFAPNQRGYSPGARPPGRHSYRMSNLVSDVVGLIDAIGAESVHLVGHDWGAAVAWSLAVAHPERVKSLVSVSVPHPGAFIRSMTSSDQLLRSYYMGVFQIPVLPEIVLKNQALARRLLGSTGMGAEQRADFQREIADTGALPYALNWYRALLIADPRALTKRASAPTTHVFSTGDTALSVRGAELAAEYTTGDYRLVLLEGSHWIPEEHPAELAEAIVQRAGAVA